MTGMYKTLEHHEHAGHIAQGGHGGGHEGAGAGAAAKPTSAQMAALLVAVLAAGLAISEQGAKQAEIRVQQNSIDAADSWAQYQAKSIRSTMAKNTAALISVLDVAMDPAAVARREKVLAGLKDDQEHYDNDPKDGKKAIAVRAHGFEHVRDHSLEQTHAYHNGSAAMELGIVLATASAIIGSKMLIRLALGVGIAGGVFSLLGYLAPQYGAF